MTTTITPGKFSLPVAGTLPEKKFTSFRQEAEEYRPVLHSIATDLGFGEKEAKELAEYVCLIGERSFAHQEESFSFKIWLAKILVHNCIFKICSSLFSQNANTGNFFQTNTYSIASPLSKIPISLRTVYILFHCARFSEQEVAQILNINIVQVRQRLSKAMTIIKSTRP